MNGQYIPKTVILEQPFPLKPTPRSLHAHKEVPGVAEIVERSKLERKHANHNQASDHESDEIPSIPG